MIRKEEHDKCAIHKGIITINSVLNQSLQRIDNKVNLIRLYLKSYVKFVFPDFSLFRYFL